MVKSLESNFYRNQIMEIQSKFLPFSDTKTILDIKLDKLFEYADDDSM